MPVYTIKVNGTERTVEAPADMPLLWVLRDLLNLTGSKFGCGVGACGACTVLIGGYEMRSCLAPISFVGDDEVITIEGVSEDGSHPLQKAFVEHDVPQCGYCQGGKILAAMAVLKDSPDATDEEIGGQMNGQICRCGTYQRMLDAIRSAAEEMK